MRSSGSEGRVDKVVQSIPARDAAVLRLAWQRVLRARIREERVGGREESRRRQLRRERSNGRGGWLRWRRERLGRVGGAIGLGSKRGSDGFLGGGRGSGWSEGRGV